MVQVLRVIRVESPLSIGLSYITSKEREIYRLNKGIFCWWEKSLSIKANQGASLSIRACELTVVF